MTSWKCYGSKAGMETISSEPSSKDCWYGDVGDGYESYDQLIMSFALTARVLHPQVDA